jgi:hypothetical protein
MQANPDRSSTTWMRSYPNRIPLSAAVVDRVTRSIEACRSTGCTITFGGTIDADARAIARRSCDRYMGWVRGDYDHLT